MDELSPKRLRVISVNYSSRFKLTLGNLEVFCNDNRTRTFIGFLAYPQDVLSECVNQLDIVLSDYDLPKYYEVSTYTLSE